MPSVRLHWLQIQRYRNVAPGTRLVFSHGLNVVLGRNGAGKTTLLRLLAALLTGKLERLKDEPFELSYGLTAAEVDLAVELRNDPEGGDWSGEIALRRRGDGDLLGRVTASGSGALLYDGHGDEPMPLESSSPFDGSSLYELLGEVSDMLGEADLDDDDDDDGDDDDDDDDDDDGDGDDDDGDDDDQGAAPVVRAAKQTLEDVYAGELRFSARELPFLEKARAALGAAEASLVLPVSEPPPADGDVSCTYHDFAFHFVTAGGAVISHDQLGDGEKRMIALFYHAAGNPDVIVADDLLSGLGHAWAGAALAEIQGRQAFISTRDPLAFAFLRPVLDDALIACAPGAQLSWKKLDAVAAASVRKSAVEGLHRAGEALLALDLW